MSAKPHPLPADVRARRDSDYYGVAPREECEAIILKAIANKTDQKGRQDYTERDQQIVTTWIDRRVADKGPELIGPVTAEFWFISAATVFKWRRMAKGLPPHGSGHGVTPRSVSSAADEFRKLADLVESIAMMEAQLVDLKSRRDRILAKLGIGPQVSPPAE